jgi:hypothetical protein
MKSVAVVIGLALSWVVLSIVFMWYPICRYDGPSGNSCLNNLRQIDGAKQLYMEDTGRTNGAVNSQEINRYLGRGPMGEAPICQSGGKYTYGNLEELPTCSLATTGAPPAVKVRSGLFHWHWKVWPSSTASHTLDTLKLSN